MKLYGSGVLRYPGTKRTVWDFEDGPFSTVNEMLIRHALNMGCTTTPPVAVEVKVEEPKADEVPTESPKPRGRGRGKK